MSGYLIDCRSKQSFPAFWIAGSIAGVAFICMGAYSILSNAGENSSDPGFLFFAISTLIMGILLLGGVIVTLIIMSDPDDLSLPVDVKKAPGRMRYDAQKLANYLDVCHNNVLLFYTDGGQMQVFGSKGCFVVELAITEQVGYKTYQLMNLSVSDVTPVIIGNAFMERFPVRKNRIVDRFMVIDVIRTLYDLQSLSELITAFPFADSTAETVRLIEKDAYILPSVPLDIPRQKDYDRISREKEERMQRAIRELKAMS